MSRREPAPRASGCGAPGGPGEAPARAADAYVGLGSNLGDRRRHLECAARALRDTPGIEEAVLSPVYETDPVGPPQPPYLNAVARVRTTLGPRQLLDRLLAIEREHGRERGATRNAPRPLDLDLLLYGDCCVRSPGLEIPHPRLHERGFVLEPLRDLAAGLRHPTLGETIEDLALRVRDPAAVRRR